MHRMVNEMAKSILKQKVGLENYMNGQDFEFRVLRRLKRTTDFVVRSAGSRSFIDLVARTSNGIRYIVCKKNGYLPPKERKVLKKFQSKMKPYEKLELFYYYNHKHFSFKLLNSAKKIDSCDKPIINGGK